MFRRRRLRCRGPAPRKRSSEQTQWRRTPAGATLPPAPCRASASDLRGQLDAALRADATRYGPGRAVSGRTNWRASERHAEKPPVSSAPDGSQRGGDQDFAANCWQPSKQYRDEARPHQMRAARTSQGVLKGDVLYTCKKLESVRDEILSRHQAPTRSFDSNFVGMHFRERQGQAHRRTGLGEPLLSEKSGL